MSRRRQRPARPPLPPLLPLLLLLPAAAAAAESAAGGAASNGPSAFDLGHLDMGGDAADGGPLPEEKTVRTGFDPKSMRCESCRVFVTELAAHVASARPHDGIVGERKLRAFYRDEVRADELIERAVMTATGDWQYVEYPDEQQKPGARGVFVRYDELLASNEKAGKSGVVATLKRERNFRDPGMLNFLRTTAEETEELLHELVFRDEQRFEQWMELYCIRATRFCTRRQDLKDPEAARTAPDGGFMPKAKQTDGEDPAAKRGAEGGGKRGGEKKAQGKRRKAGPSIRAHMGEEKQFLKPDKEVADMNRLEKLEMLKAEGFKGLDDAIKKEKDILAQGADPGGPGGGGSGGGKREFVGGKIPLTPGTFAAGGRREAETGPKRKTVANNPEEGKGAGRDDEL